MRVTDLPFARPELAAMADAGAAGDQEVERLGEDVIDQQQPEDYPPLGGIGLDDVGGGAGVDGDVSEAEIARRASRLVSAL